MANGVTKLGGGWDQAPDGTAETALGKLLAAGALDGETLVDELKAQGFGARGPAYYPEENGKGPFYALGNPHTYAAIDNVDGVEQWDLIGFDPSLAVISVPPGGLPSQGSPPAPIVNFSDAVAALIAAMDAVHADQLAEIKVARDETIAAVREAQEAIQTQIDQVVKNAENSARLLLPIAEAAIPALSGLFAPK